VSPLSPGARGESYMLRCGVNPPICAASQVTAPVVAPEIRAGGWLALAV